MQTILGIYGIDSCADIIEAAAVGTLSLSIFVLGDSNLTQNGGGFSDGISWAFEQLGRPKIASNPLIGLIINDGAGRVAFKDEDQLWAEAATNPGPYSGAPAGLQPSLPWNALEATNNAILAVMDNRPARFGGGAAHMGTCKINVNKASNPSLGHNIHEKFDVHVPHIKGPGLGSFNMWTTSLPSNINAGYVGTLINCSAAAFAYDDGYCGTMNAGQVQAGDTVFQIYPFGINFAHTGDGAVLGAMIKYPDRPHGYCIGSLTNRGGTSMDGHAFAWNTLQNDWVDHGLRRAALGAGGRDTWLVLWISLGLNDRTGGDTTKEQYRADLDIIVDKIDARFTALRAAGLIGSNVKGVMIIADVCGVRVSVNPEGLDHCYAACREKADQRGRMVVMDNRDFITPSWSAVITPDGQHIDTVTHYRQIARDNLFRLVTAARKARGLRRIA